MVGHVESGTAFDRHVADERLACARRDRRLGRLVEVAVEAVAQLVDAGVGRLGAVGVAFDEVVELVALGAPPPRGVFALVAQRIEALFVSVVRRWARSSSSSMAQACGSRSTASSASSWRWLSSKVRATVSASSFFSSMGIAGRLR